MPIQGTNLRRRQLICLVFALLLLFQAACLTGGAVADSSPIRGWNGSSYIYVYFGEYPQESGSPSPILWRVLTVSNGRALLLSEFVLHSRPFDGKSTDWRSSDIKSWLNGSFLRNAFPTDYERDCLLSSSELGTVFLLSKAEYLNPDYGFSKRSDVKDRARVAPVTTYAVDKGLWVSSEYLCSYYTRTKDSGSTVVQIRTDGTMGSARYDRDNVGIRPAIWIDLDYLDLSQGEGTLYWPYQ